MLPKLPGIELFGFPAQIFLLFFAELEGGIAEPLRIPFRYA